MSNVDLGNVNEFLDVMAQFLGQLRIAFPSCRRVERYDKSFRIALRTSSVDVKKRCVQEYVDVMHPYYERCAARDTTLLQENILFLSRLALPEKWDIMDDETKDVVWLYIENLNSLASGVQPVVEESAPPLGIPTEAFAVAQQFMTPQGGIDKAKLRQFVQSSIPNDPTIRNDPKVATATAMLNSLTSLLLD